MIIPPKTEAKEAKFRIILLILESCSSKKEYKNFLNGLIDCKRTV
jgi:hypothetical protein